MGENICQCCNWQGIIFRNIQTSHAAEKAMAPHSIGTLVWKIPWTEKPGRMQSMGSLRVGHDWGTSLSFFTFHALGKEMATHSSVLAWRIPGTGEPDGLPAVYGVAQSRTRLKRLSSSSMQLNIKTTKNPINLAENLEGIYPKKTYRCQKGIRAKKRCSTQLIIRER